MSFGLRVWNPGNDLVIADDAAGLVLIHKATHTGTVQPTGTATGAFPGRVGGYSTYTSNHNGRILCAVDLPLGDNVGIISVTGSPGAWTIKAYRGATPDSFGFDVQSALDVWVFATPLTMSTTFSMALFNAAGTLAHDLGWSNPLYPRGLAQFTATGGAAVTLPTLTRPVAVGVPSGDRLLTTVLGANSYADTTQRQTLRRISAASMNVFSVTEQRYQYFGVDPSGNDRDDYLATVSFIIEGSLLP